MIAAGGLPPSHRLELGRRAMEAHDYTRAAALAEPVVQALDGASDVDELRLLVRALGILACSRHEVAADESWSDLLDRAQGLVESSGLDDLRVPVVGATAYCHLRAGDVHAALALFDSADTWLEDATVEDRVRFLLNRGFARLELGNLRAAGRDLDRVEEEGTRAGLHELAQKARHNLGYLAFLEGDLPGALDRFATAIADADEIPEVVVLMADPIALTDRARVLQEAGLADEADDLLARALGELSGSGRTQDEGEVHLARARGALVAGDLDLAAEQTDRAAEHFARRGNHRWERRATFVRLAVRLEQLQAQERSGQDAADAVATIRGTRLADDIEDLAHAADEVGDVEHADAARFMLAEAAVLAGDLDRATRALDGPTPEDASVSVQLRWHRARAGLSLARGTDDVQQVVHAGLTALGRAQSRLGSIDLRTAMAIHGRELAELGVADAIARGDDEQVHEAVERSHASSTRLAPVRVDATAEEAAFLARLRRASEALWRLDTAAAPDRAEDLRREIAALQHDLRQQGWQRTATGSDVDLVGLEEVRRHLDRTGAVVVSFTSVGPRLCAVRIDRDAVRVVELGSMAEILRLVEQLRSDLQAVVLPGIPESVRAVMKGSVRTTLGRLDDHLLGPLDLDEPPLVVVPHGALALVPWSLVPSRLGLATTTIPSLTTWARSNAQARHRPGTEPVSVVAMAGPGLERADAEVLAVAGAWPDARSVRGGAATGPALQAALHRATVVHLAAHGHHQASSPLFSSLRLADGPIFAHELDPDPTARLVVLSSCEVGSHTVRHGDEPLGLTAALLQAGVPTVLAGLARVRDDTAHDLMIDLHHQVVEGATPAQALATAVHRAWERGRVAPFACLGAGLLPVG